MTTGTNNSSNYPYLTTDGQIPIGSSIGNPTSATITAGTNVTVTNGHNTITIAATGGAFATVNQTTGTVTMAAFTRYITNDASQVVYTIPATAAIGDTFIIIGTHVGAAGWQIQANTGQTVYYGIYATSSAGTLTSNNQYDCVTITCTTANVSFTAYATQGNLTAA